jgi:hypothetical protein
MDIVNFYLVAYEAWNDDTELLSTMYFLIPMANLIIHRAFQYHPTSHIFQSLLIDNLKQCKHAI